ncbi:MAG: hypothetical protein R2834_19685 [Rhodothermales bacterium]
MEPVSETSPSVGLLIVHGIGEQKAGETRDKLVHGLSRAYGDRLRVAESDPVDLELDGKTVRLYEVYWADLLSGDRVRDSFRWGVVQALGWFPWLNWKHGLLKPPLHSRALILAWSVVLVPATLSLYLLYLGARFFAQLGQEALGSGEKPVVSVEPGAGRWARLRATSNAYAAQAREGRTPVEDLLDGFAGDVTNYMASLCGAVDAGTDLDGAAGAILQRFYRAAADACDDGCETIQILSHSLGTVVAYHGLTGRLLEQAEGDPGARRYDLMGRLTRLYTIGSPLEKIRFFWPSTIAETPVGTLTARGDTMVLAAGGEPVEGRFRWDNFYHRFDRVSGRLKRFDHWGAVVNHALKGGGGLVRSHVIYEQSPEFLDAISEGLFGAPAGYRPSRAARLRDGLVSSLENLGLPIGMMVPLLFGIVLGVAVALVPGYLLSLPVRWLGFDSWVGVVQGVPAVLMGISILYAATLGGLHKADALHARWTRRDGSAGA